MGTKQLDFTKPITTRAGSKVDIYYIREGVYINGGYYSKEDDVYFPVQWDWEGNYASKKSALDLVNEKTTSRTA